MLLAVFIKLQFFVKNGLNRSEAKNLKGQKSRFELILLIRQRLHNCMSRIAPRKVWSSSMVHKALRLVVIGISIE